MRAQLGVIFVMLAISMASGRHFEPAQQKVSSDTECAICEFIVKEVESHLANNKTETEIIHKLEVLCSKFGSIGAECKAVVDTYAPQVIAMLLEKEDPQTVCTQLKVCSSGDERLKNVAKRWKKSGAKGGGECAICEFIVKEAEAELAKNKTEAEIIAALDKVCSHLGAIKSECTALVNQYAPQIIAMLVNKEPPQTVCTQLGLCKSFKAFRAQSDTGCAICEFIVKAAEEELAQNKTQAEIIAALDKICDHLGAIKGECAVVVNTYAPQIIALLENKEPPQTVCTQIGLCKSSDSGRSDRRTYRANKIGMVIPQ